MSPAWFVPGRIDHHNIQISLTLVLLATLASPLSTRRAIGAGLTGGNPNDGQASVGGKGLNGYAAMADYLERRGYAVSRVQSLASLKHASY